LGSWEPFLANLFVAAGSTGTADVALVRRSTAAPGAFYRGLQMPSGAEASRCPLTMKILPVFATLVAAACSEQLFVG